MCPVRAVALVGNVRGHNQVHRVHDPKTRPLTPKSKKARYPPPLSEKEVSLLCYAATTTGSERTETNRQAETKDRQGDKNGRGRTAGTKSTTTTHAPMLRTMLINTWCVYKINNQTYVYQVGISATVWGVAYHY